MIFYRNHHESDGGSGGYTWFTCSRAAMKDAKANKRKGFAYHLICERIELPEKKKALCAFLNNYAGHADNG